MLHRAPDQTSHLASILARATRLRLVRPVHGAAPEHGACYVAETHMHLAIVVRAIEAIGQHPEASVGSHRRAVLLFGGNAGPRAIGVVLSGMLKDGAFGLRALKDAGGVTLVQDPDEAEFGELPNSAIRVDGGIDMIGSLEDLAEKVLDLTMPDRGAGQDNSRRNRPMDLMWISTRAHPAAQTAS